MRFPRSLRFALLLGLALPSLALPVHLWHHHAGGQPDGRCAVCVTATAFVASVEQSAPAPAGEFAFSFISPPERYTPSCELDRVRARGPPLLGVDRTAVS